MNANIPEKEKAELAKAAAIATASTLGNEFWSEVAQHLDEKKDLVTPRQIVEKP